MKNNISPYILIFLAVLSQAHTLYGRNLKKWIWWLSIVSAILFGFYLGFFVASYPQSIIGGIIFSIVLLAITMLTR